MKDFQVTYLLYFLFFFFFISFVNKLISHLFPKTSQLNVFILFFSVVSFYIGINVDKNFLRYGHSLVIVLNQTVSVL